MNHLGYRPIKTKREQLIDALLTGDWSPVLRRIGEELDSMIIRDYGQA